LTRIEAAIVCFAARNRGRKPYLCGGGTEDLDAQESKQSRLEEHDGQRRGGITEERENKKLLLRCETEEGKGREEEEEAEVPKKRW
jgi:hypothetical protein